jgi:predicted TIM-barrel fold metal-dependent hydrolase
MAQIFDFYFQIGVDDWARNNRPELAHASNREDFKRHTEEFAAEGHQYQGAVIFPPPSDTDLSYTQANRIIYETATGGPAQSEQEEIFFPVYAVAPRNSGSLEWLKRRLEEGGPVLGIKLWPYMGRFSLTDFLRDKELVELVLRHRLLVMMHVGTGRELKARNVFADVAADPATAVQVAAELPEADFLFAHLLRLSEPALEKAAQLKNVYLDTSGLTSLGKWQEGGRNGLPANDAGNLAAQAPVEIIGRLAEEFGLSEKLIFGSNWPFCKWWGSSVREEASLILDAPISSRSRENILAGNALRLLAQHGTGIEGQLARYDELSSMAQVPA